MACSQNIQLTTFHSSKFQTKVILGIDSSGDFLGVALVENGQVIAQAKLSENRKHSERIGPIISELLESRKKQLASISISGGPGSYTGLRIGSSIAKGLCFSLEIPLVSVSSHLVRSFNHLGSSGQNIFSILPSRRGEVYAAKIKSDHQTSEDVESLALTIDEAENWISRHDGDNPVIAGSGVPRLSKDFLIRNRKVISNSDVTSHAVAVAILGERRFNAGLYEDLASYEPLYLKPFVAKQGTPIFERLEKNRKSN